jgi:hypothetical protein
VLTARAVVLSSHGGTPDKEWKGMTKMSFGDQLSDSLVHKSFRFTVEADINQSMSTRGEL